MGYHLSGFPPTSDFGATHPVDSSERPMRDAVDELVPGGVDYAFEVVGNPDLVAQTFALTQPVSDKKLEQFGSHKGHVPRDDERVTAGLQGCFDSRQTAGARV